MLNAERISNDTRIIDLTVGELKDLIASVIPVLETKKEKKLVYGLDGLAKLFGCSKSAAYELKRSGKIDKAITQLGRKIVVDSELALQLAGKNK